VNLVYALHGIVDRPDSRLFCHRNMSDAARVRALLDTKEKFVSLPEALAGRGAAITIDDATVAAARTALLIRGFGHTVTLFVNPWQIEDGRAYAFCTLNALLDQTPKRKFMWYGKTYNLRKPRDTASLRAAVKHILRGQSDPEQNYLLIDEIRQSLGVEHIDIPDHLRSLTVAELRDLRDAGVDLQNHYWTHLDPAAHTPARFADEWLRGQDWLADKLGISSQFFASPFGEYFPTDDFLAARNVTCLLLDARYPTGPLRSAIVNRQVFA
jgi:hypothetical protein